MEDEFIKASPSLPSQECVFGIPESAGFAMIALALAEKAFNFKAFDDRVHAHQCYQIVLL
jgi:hypothetical protein